MFAGTMPVKMISKKPPPAAQDPLTLLHFQINTV